MEKGDIIRWEYDAWIVEEGKEELFDTTNEELAKENGIHDPNIKYGPMVSVVGAGRLIKGMEEEIQQAEIGKEYIVTIPPENAYGERDPKLVKIHSYRELARQKITPEIGKEVVIDNKRGRIVTVTPGRVVIDFNHPLAGKTLKYRFKIVEKIEGDVDKVRAILEMDYGKELDNFKIDIRDDEIVIELPDSCKYDSSWAMAKYMVVSDIREYVGNKDIKFVEVYKKKEEPKEEAQESKEETTEEKEAPEEQNEESEEKSEE
ncbi:MAG: peptidylprolyl isomerase [Euryarchaeota archaeon]|nr:peptidylprolyl isomerase [Euryarchaeota archaeon]